MIKILSVQSISNHEIEVSFETGETKWCDLSRYLDKGIFKQLNNHDLFRHVRSVGFGVKWPNEADLSSDTLYAIGISQTSDPVQKCSQFSIVNFSIRQLVA